MNNIHTDLREKILKCNEELKDNYKDFTSIKKSSLRDFIEKNIGQIKKLEKLDQKALEEVALKGGIVAVDGSSNRKGSLHPHYIDFFQAMAKSTKSKEEIFKSEISSPLISRQEDQEEEASSKDIILARLEVEVALESVRVHKPHAILMDGSLIRYYIYAKEAWLDLREACEREGVLLVGVIEDIKTRVLGEALKAKGLIENDLYDREALYGRLDYGEIILIEDQVSKKHLAGYSSAFMRTSLGPNIIGIDILDSQGDRLEAMSRLVLTLTPENSRGIPLWLDLVDEEVKISNALMDGLIESYMDRDIYEKLFVPVRDKR